MIRAPWSPALAAYLTLAGLAGDGGGEAAPRPAGPLLWVHADDGAHAGAVAALADRLGQRDEGGAIATLLTLPPGRDLPAAAGPAILRRAPPERLGAVRAFLRHWRPDLLLWVGGNLRPCLISRTAAPKILVEGAPAPRLLWRGNWAPGLARGVVPLFERALVTGAEAAARLRRAGLPEARIAVAPPFDAPAPVLPCNERERRDLAHEIGARPVWLAGDLPLAELPAVVAAQLRASRGAHRLLLIVAPRVAEETEAFAARLAEAGLRVSSRAEGDEPGEDAQVFLADGTAEMGLWLRLAPVSFVGGTLGGSGGRHPFEGAALGSALLHGPRTAPFEDAWARLHAAGAARLVRTGTDLGEAVEALLAPDRAAVMARGAWDVTTEGAEVSNLVERLVRERIGTTTGADRPGARAGEA